MSKGYWRVQKWNPVKETNIIIGAINKPNDCGGDDLYNEMISKGWIASIDNYECDGDNTSVVMLGNVEGAGDFSLDFIYQ